MSEMGVPKEMISEFQNPKRWLDYFPPVGIKDLKRLGLATDWRRSFITTSENPYYDAFIRWQFNTLHKKKKLEFGKRNSIFSPREGQPCADHDRSSGEGVQPQDYTLVKIVLQKPYPKQLDFVKEKKIILPAATLRPETMYGQTNVFLLPSGEYGVYDMGSNEVFVCSSRSALNMAYQELTPLKDNFNNLEKIKLGTVLGESIIGCAVKAPLCPYEKVYVLPLLTIKMTKGTGVVTSVPSDAPDDYAALMDLKKKAKLREKFNLTEEMVLPFKPIPIINTPGLGTQPAVDLCIKMKVQSQNDTQKLADIKAKCYLESFYKGIMIVEDFKDVPVSKAKDLIKDKMIKCGQALAYSEPESLVINRSGDECVVAFTDQWYLKYGEEGWKNKTEKHIKETLETYNPAAKKKYCETINWLREWACSREFGLGTKLPMDKKFVIESLSDSTVYFAYYTIVHYLHEDLNGAKPGKAGIGPEALTDEVFDFIFLEGNYPANCPIKKETLEEMKAEFNYWYPMDLRCSGKDLINNHLTMALYNHTAVWDNKPEMWPRSYYTNGHIMINAEKMSKSTGNFLTISQAIDRFGCDATRMAFADGGDGLNDGNFAPETANKAILTLTKEKVWIEELLQSPDLLKTSSDKGFMDLVFENEINVAIAKCDSAYSRMRFHDALVAGFFDLWNARDMYRVNVEQMNRDLVLRFIEVAIIMLSPFCPHWCQHIWEKIGKKGFIANAAWPIAQPENTEISEKILYLRETSNSFRSLLTKKKKEAEKRKKKGIDAEISQLKTATIYVAETYPPHQSIILEELNKLYKATGTLPDNRKMAGNLREVGDLKTNKKKLKTAMAFAAQVKKDFETRGKKALALKVRFDEMSLLKTHKVFVTNGMNLQKIDFESEKEAVNSKIKVAVPGKPRIIFQ